MNAFVPPRPAARGHRYTGFTLVELLVVIGIIALLVSILLPTLSSARKKANAVKCEAALREIGHCFQMYAVENKGAWPVTQWNNGGATAFNYNINGFSYTQCYWYDFLAKYVTKGNTGLAAATADDATRQRRTVFWGCPAWDGYVSSAIGGINRSQQGYGMNKYPSFRNNYPNGTANPPDSEAAYISGPNYGKPSGPGVSGNGIFVRQVNWKNAAERCLVADAIFWLAFSNPAPNTGNYPKSIVPQNASYNSATETPGSKGQTYIDLYRHGTYPSVKGTGSNATFDPNGSRISFNILYCDGHVVNEVQARQAYVAIRQHFPN